MKALLDSSTLIAAMLPDHVHHAALARKSLGGGLVYDAIIARSVALAHVDRLVTLNVRDFLQVWPGDPEQITSPLLVTPTS